MSHKLEINELKQDQLLLIAQEKDEGCFLNQNFPTPPLHTFWLGGFFKKNSENYLEVEIKIFKDLETLDIDSPLTDNILTIPKKNIALSIWYCGIPIIFLKTNSK
jgi:hypothetical protein